MSIQPIPLFLNPTAGRGRAGKRRSDLVELLTANGAAVDLQLSDAVGDLEERVFEHAVAGEKRIIVAGGDGSIHEAANGILRSEQAVSLGVIPVGTGNDFAKACDIPLNWEHAASLLADRLQANQAPRHIDAGRCNERFFVNGAGVGFDAKVNQLARSIRLPLGDIVYLLAVLRGLIDGVASPRLELRSDEVLWHGPLTLANVSNGPWVGGLFKIAPTADIQDQLFDLIIAKAVSRRRVLALLPKLVKGSHIDEDEIEHHRVRKLSILADRDLPSHLDGEVQAPQSKFEIQMLPGALRLI